MKMERRGDDGDRGTGHWVAGDDGGAEVVIVERRGDKRDDGADDGVACVDGAARWRWR